MTVAVPSTPASYFHLLRRHSLDGIRRPLVVFTPKSMLRNKAAVSDVEDFTTGKFRSVFEEPTYETGDAERDKVRRVLLVSGKLYWELLAKKQKDNREDIAIVRIEQLYPVPSRRLRETLDRYPNAPSSGGFRRSRRTRVRGRSSVSLCRVAARQAVRNQAHLASFDVGTVLGFEQGARCGTAGDHR